MTAPEFDWSRDDSVVVKPQNATAVYLNEDGDVVIRQERLWDEAEDQFVVVSVANVPAVVSALLRAANLDAAAAPLALPKPDDFAPSSKVKGGKQGALDV